MKKKLENRLLLRVLLKLLGVVVIMWITITLLATVRLQAALKVQDFQTAIQSSQLLTPTSQVLSVITFQSNHTLEVIDSSLSLLSRAEELPTTAHELQTQLASENLDISPFLVFVSTSRNDFIRLKTHLPKCRLCHHFLDAQQLLQLTESLDITLTLSEKAADLLKGRHTYILLFQNADELRASGGFMGSYALLTLQDGLLEPLQVKDIYDADGQFDGYIPAPAGVQEYLSSDRGLRLPDANWEPHFPTSAKQIITFFSAAEKEPIEGVIALNSKYFESLMELLGPLWLPDYQLTVTANNLTDVLRTNREDFFAGSIQKKHLLEQFQNQVFIRLSQALSDNEITLIDLVAVTTKNMQQKNILLYSTDQEIQQLSAKLMLDGALLETDTENYLAFVESNVGINKANKNVTRALSLTANGTKLTATYQIKNTNESLLKTDLQALVAEPAFTPIASASADHLGYINYQRVLYPASWTLLTSFVGKQPVEPQHQTTIGLANGQLLTQSAFLVPVAERSEETLTLTFQAAGPLSGAPLELFKQPGVDPYPVWIATDQQQAFEGNSTLILEKNSVTIIP